MSQTESMNVLNQRTILLIDDNPDDLSFYTDLLKRTSGEYSYSIITASNSEQGVQAFQSNDIDCTFVDFNMPGLDGLATVNALQKIAGHENVPVVLITGEPTQRIQANAARAGAMDFIVKEAITSSEQLERVINKVIAWATELSTTTRTL